MSYPQSTSHSISTSISNCSSNSNFNTEAFDRNHSLELIHNTRLPSYALWGDDDVIRETQAIRLTWWKDVVKEYETNKCKNDEVYRTILKWINYYER